MMSLIVLLVKQATAVAAVALSVLAVIGSPSLAGFALGALLAGASFLVLNARRGVAAGVGAGGADSPRTYDRPAESRPYAEFWGPVEPPRGHGGPRHAAPSGALLRLW